MEKVCVLGAGSTKYGKLDDSISDITIQASVSAIENAGIEPKEIQAGYISNVFGVADKQVHLGPVVMSNLGISECPSLSIESACGSGSVSFREAFANVAAGFYASPILAGNKIYLMDRAGKMHIFAPEKQFKSLGQPSLEEVTVCTPVVIGNAIYYRGTQHLYKIGP